MKDNKGHTASGQWSVQPTEEVRGISTTAKVESSKDISKVLDYFRYNVGTSLDCAIATHVLRNSITWYIDMLEKEQLLQAVYKKPDSTTGYKAKYYTADRSLWSKQPTYRQLSLFGEV